MTKVAIVVGGAESVWEELQKARQLCDDANLEYQLLVCNDMIGEYKGDAIGITLHGFKIEGWLNQRRDRRFIPLGSLWFYERHQWVTNVQELKWAGSVGQYAVQIALLNLNYQRVLLCGVPMDPTKRHFLSKQPWKACQHFTRPWMDHKNAMIGKVRSFSGLTQQILGEPTLEWLQQVNANMEEVV